MIREFYDKNELGFSIIWIIAYCILASIGDNISDELGIAKVIVILQIEYFLSPQIHSN